jgi:hypothetical protein
VKRNAVVPSRQGRLSRNSSRPSSSCDKRSVAIGGRRGTAPSAPAPGDRWPRSGWRPAGCSPRPGRTGGPSRRRRRRRRHHAREVPDIHGAGQSRSRRGPTLPPGRPAAECPPRSRVVQRPAPARRDCARRDGRRRRRSSSPPPRVFSSIVNSRQRR